VVIEFNPTIPSEVAFVQADANLNQGASLRALVELGNRKGYRLAAATSWNAIFVVEEDWERLQIEEDSVARSSSTAPSACRGTRWRSGNPTCSSRRSSDDIRPDTRAGAGRSSASGDAGRPPRAATQYDTNPSR
jgi:hypothetical protein